MHRQPGLVENLVMEESAESGDLLRVRLYRSIIQSVIEESLISGTEAGLSRVSTEVLKAFAESLSPRHYELFSGVWSVEFAFLEIGLRSDRLVG